MLELNYPPSGSARDCTEPLYCFTPSHVLTDLSALSILSSTASFSTFIVYVLTFFFFICVSSRQWSSECFLVPAGYCCLFDSQLIWNLPLCFVTCSNPSWQLISAAAASSDSLFIASNLRWERQRRRSFQPPNGAGPVVFSLQTEIKTGKKRE